MDGLELGEEYLSDTDNWVSHAFLHKLYARMMDILGDRDAVYKMALASERFQSLGLLDRIVRLLGNPKLIYLYAPRYNKLLKLNGDVRIRDLGNSSVLLEDRYHDGSTKTRYDCDYTRGIVAGIPTLFGMAIAQVEEVECQVLAETYGERSWADTPDHGRPGCLYRVQWDPGSKRRRWTRALRRRGIYGKAIQDLQEANQKIQAKYEEVRTLLADLETANRELKAYQSELETKAEELRASERRYRLLAENVRDVIWTLDVKTLRFTYISPSVEKARGFTPEEAMQLSLDETLAPGFRETATQALAEELARDGSEGVDPNRARTLEIQQLCRGGTYAWAEATMTFLRDGQGRPSGILGVTRDISERKRAEEEKARLEAILLHAQKMESLGTLAGGIAHDFNNFLTGILGNISVVSRQEGLPIKTAQRLAEAEKAADRARGLTQQLLSFSRGGAPVKKSVSIGKLLRESTTFALHGSGARCRLDLDDDLWPAEVDEGQINQALNNLVINADQAMPDGGTITVRARNRSIPQGGEPPLAPGKHVEIIIEDTGPGIPAELQERVFDPFFTTKPTGTGLGLASTFSIVRNHGGHLAVETASGGGARFVITLPATSRPIEEKPQPTAGSIRGTGRILVMDDEEIVRNMLGEALSELGYRAAGAADGEEALVAYRRAREEGDPFDAVVMDLTIPGGLSGKETIARLLEVHPAAKVVVSSGYSNDPVMADYTSYGFAAVLAKPYRLEDIGEVLKKLLEDGANIVGPGNG